ncbi:MAG TPA: hypothetical protein VMU04_18785 [Candidatus Acidoferrum sp.]|nr:hypothetical protein [Candidatus Acidoferrum sp.]
MNTQIDLKSALVGLGVGVLIMLAVGAAGPATDVGRYQACTGAGFVTIIDTTTGQAWGANLSAPVPGFQGVPGGFWDKKPRE